MRLILNFTIPLILGNLFQQIYNIADSIIVGRTLGADALASVGASTSIVFLIIGFVMGTCSGFAIPVAQNYGGRRYSDMRRYVMNGMLLAAGLAVVLTVLTCILCMPILTWMDTPENIIQGGYDYLIVIFIGIPFTFLYNMLAGIIRSLGDSRTPFLFLLLSTVLNIIGDFVFILYFHMGVEGAAIATILAQAVSGILCLLYMQRRFDILKLQPEEKKPSTALMGKLLYIGIPMGLQFSITAIGSIMLQTAINGLGTVIVTAYAAAMKIKQLVMCPFDAIGNAMATFGGQNLGAAKYKRIYQGLRASLTIGIVYGIIAFLILFFQGSNIASLFIDKSNVEILAAAQQYLTTIGIFYFVLAILIITRSAIQGLGYSMLAFFGGVLEMIARTFVALVIIPRYGYTAACFTDPAAWVSATVFLIPLFFYVMRKIQKKAKAVLL